MDSIIKYENVDVTFATYPVIQRFSLDISRGEVISFFGPSGCGKSTLLKLLLGLLLPVNGKVSIDNIPASEYNGTMAYTPQDNQLLPWKSIEANIELWRKKSENGLKKAFSTKEAISIVELTEHKEKLPFQISGGMARRTALARCLATNSSIMALDEVFVSIEKSMRRRLMIGIRQHIKDKGITGVLISHDFEETVFMSDRIVVLTPGAGEIKKIIRVDLPSERDLTTFELNSFKTVSLDLIT